MKHGYQNRRSLTIGLSTTVDRFKSFALDALVPHPGVTYIISIQGCDHDCFADVENAISDTVNRLDFEVLTSIGFGVAKSRNLILKACTSDFLWFCDDDIEFEIKDILSFVSRFSAYQDSYFACGISLDENGDSRKAFPKDGVKLNRFNTAKYATFEIVVRPQKIKELGVWFDDDFGAGAKNVIGDEYIFLADVISKRGDGMFFSMPMCTHKERSSGLTDKNLREFCGLTYPVFRRVFPYSWPAIWCAFMLRYFIQSSKPMGGLLQRAQRAQAN